MFRFVVHTSDATAEEGARRTVGCSGVGAWLALVLAIAALAHGGSLFEGFHADDWFQVAPRPIGTVLATFTGDWNEGERIAAGFYRPLVRVLFALDSLLWGSRPAGYHFTNFVLMLAMAAGTFSAACILSARKPAVAAFAALWMVLQPFHVEPIHWLSARGDLVVAASIAWAVWAGLSYLMEGRGGHLAATCALLGTALLSKESAVAGCLVLPAAAVLLAPADAPRWRRRNLVFAPIMVGILYALARRLAVPGLGGYHALRSDPLTIEGAWSGFTTILSAMTAPSAAWGDAEGLSGNAGWALAGAAFLAVTSGFSRGVLLGLLGVFLSLLPTAGLSVSPATGGRLVLLPSLFWVLALASWLGTSGLGRIARFVVLPLCPLLFLSWNTAGSEARTGWREAAKPSSAAVAAAWGEMQRAANGARFAVHDLPARTANRLLRPGDAMTMALRTSALWDGWSVAWKSEKASPYAWLEISRSRESRTLLPVLSDPATSGTVLITARRDGSVAFGQVLDVQRIRLEAPAPSNTVGMEKPVEFRLPRRVTGYLTVEGEVELRRADGGRVSAVSRSGAELAAAPIAYPRPDWPSPLFVAPLGEVRDADRILWQPASRPTPFALRSMTLLVYRMQP